MGARSLVVASAARMLEGLRQGGHHARARSARPDRPTGVQGQRRQHPQPPPGRRPGGGRGPRRGPGVLLRPRPRGHRVEHTRHSGHGVPDRVDHQDVHGDRRDAAVRAGAGRPGCAGQQLPARLPAGPRQGPLPAREGAPPAHPHRRDQRAGATLRAAAAGLRRDREARRSHPLPGRVLPRGLAPGGRAGHPIPVRRPWARHARAAGRGRQRAALPPLPA
jgi:hypothetical protein